MNAGAHISHAAHLAAEAQRVLLSAVLHLEAGEAVLIGIDGLVAEVDVAHIDVAILLEELGLLADILQRIADAYGHREMRRALSVRDVAANLADNEVAA